MEIHITISMIVMAILFTCAVLFIGISLGSKFHEENPQQDEIPAVAPDPDPDINHTNDKIRRLTVFVPGREPIIVENCLYICDEDRGEPPFINVSKGDAHINFAGMPYQVEWKS